MNKFRIYSTSGGLYYIKRRGWFRWRRVLDYSALDYDCQMYATKTFVSLPDAISYVDELEKRLRKDTLVWESC